MAKRSKHQKMESEEGQKEMPKWSAKDEKVKGEKKYAREV